MDVSIFSLADVKTYVILIGGRIILHAMIIKQLRWMLFAVAVLLLAANVHGADNESPDAAVKLREDLARLVELNVISSADCWQENAVKGRSCAGEEVASLLLAIAKRLGTADNMEQALDLLLARKIIINNYWRDNVLQGRKCNGEYVRNMIHSAARVLQEDALIRKYGSPPGVIACPSPSAFCPLLDSVQKDSFNYIIGTQTFGPSYQFTKKTKLEETAEAIMEMGSTVIKFEMSKRYGGRNGNTGIENANIMSLTDLARDEPSHRKVLEIPFSYFVIWAHTFSAGGWHRKFKKEALAKEYSEMYEFVCYLLKTYSGTGKTFYLGHWEGDGWLRGTTARENDTRVTPEAVQSMVDWLSTRQRAVDDAKRDTAHKGVQVWHYTEVNHVWLAMEGRPALVNMVLPKVAVDLVSYSSYDTQKEPVKFKAALNYIESKLLPKPAITGKRIFIGEYGFPSEQFTPEKQDAMARQVMRTAIEWGCPFVLYWEMYNNEVENGKQRGFWMIDDRGVRQPVYHTHQDFYCRVKKYVADFVAKSGRKPTNDEFRAQAVTFLNPGK